MGKNKSSPKCTIDKIVRFTNSDGEEKLFASLKPTVKGKAFNAFVRMSDENTFEYQKQNNDSNWTPFELDDSERKKLDEARKTELCDIKLLKDKITVKKLITVTNLYEEWYAEKELLEHTVFEGSAVDSVIKDSNDKITWLNEISFTVKPHESYYMPAAENNDDGETESQEETSDGEKRSFRWAIKFSCNNSDIYNGTLSSEEDQLKIIEVLKEACNKISPSRIMARHLGTEKSDFKLVKFSGYKRNKDDKNAIVYSIENGCIMTGLYCGVINFGDKKTPPLEIRTKYSDTFVMRMINRCCGIYASESPKTDSSLNSDSIYSKIVQYLYMLSLGKVIKLLVPQRYRYIKGRGYNIRGNVDINAYISRDIIAKDKKVSYVYPERREIQPIIDVLYSALKCCRVSVNSSLPELGGYEAYLESIYSGRWPSRNMIKNIQREKCLKNGLYSSFKRPLELAAVLLENEDINMFGEDSASGVKGLLMDSSFLWEQYLEDLMVRYLDTWNVNSQSEINYYPNTFYSKNNRPDFILTNNKTNDIFILDAKFKDMNFKKGDVDNDDIHQLHCYSYYFLLNYGSKFRGTALVYPSKIDQPKKEEELSKKEKNICVRMLGTKYDPEVESMDFFDQKFGILTLKDLVITEGSNAYEPDSSIIDLAEEGRSLSETEILDLNEEAFIKRLKDFLEEANTAEQDQPTLY